ncbi:MAG: flagellar hook-associated protein FlgK [Paracoccus sp. (in: a-proteobacteria)]|uniref:flagellar hook-associated protein FlgK n=1 Tax=Paracoccus sp. TaxID=267 RepID=UPI0039E4CA01
MSLSSAISNALSGLTAATRGTELVSTNISNKSVAGYARRELELSSRLYSGNGGGVAVDGVRRTVSAGLLADNRLAQASASNSGGIADFHAAIEEAYGTADDSGALSAQLTALDAALSAASARPDSDLRLAAVVEAASALTGRINDIAATIQAQRQAADKNIASDIDSLNTALERVANLNRQITVLTAQGEDPSSLIDARQAAIDEIAGIVPIQEVQRENGRVALFTKGGAALLDGQQPARLEFAPAAAITPDMSLQNGALASVVLNGRTLSTAEMSMLSGGSLSANFAIRDDLAPGYQSQIDALAREIYVRFSDSTVDPTLAAGLPGIFTDSQAAFLPANELGLANRLSVNALVDTSQGGALWRVRSGIGAAASGDLGDGSILLSMSAAMEASRPPASSAVSSAGRSLLGFVSELASTAASQRISAQSLSTQEQSRADTLHTALLAQGVDTDTEMEALLSLERSYAANARVLQTVNDMLDQILRLT